MAVDLSCIQLLDFSDYTFVYRHKLDLYAPNTACCLCNGIRFLMVVVALSHLSVVPVYLITRHARSQF